VKIDSKGNLINQDFAELIKSKSESISETDAVKAINTILEHRKKLTQNSSPTLTVESLISATGIKI
jgi:hypothetical protein